MDFLFGRLVPWGSVTFEVVLGLVFGNGRVWTCKIFGQVLPEMLFVYMSTSFFTGRGLEIDEIHF